MLRWRRAIYRRGGRCAWIRLSRCDMSSRGRLSGFALRKSLLTRTFMAASLKEMRFVKTILLMAIAVAIAVYTTDCGAMTTPDEAMQCCNSMPCSSHGQGQNQQCCETMPSAHAPFIQPASVRDQSFSPVLAAVLPAFCASQDLDSAADFPAAHCHAPPIPQAATPSPLRV